MDQLYIIQTAVIPILTLTIIVLWVSQILLALLAVKDQLAMAPVFFARGVITLRAPEIAPVYFVRRANTLRVLEIAPVHFVRRANTLRAPEIAPVHFVRRANTLRALQIALAYFALVTPIKINVDKNLVFSVRRSRFQILVL